MDWIYAAKSQVINLAAYDDPQKQLSEGATRAILHIAQSIGDEAQFATVLTALRDMHMNGTSARPSLEEAFVALQHGAIVQALDHSDLSEQDSIELGTLIKKHREKMKKGETPAGEQIIAIAYQIGPHLLHEVFPD